MDPYNDWIDTVKKYMFYENGNGCFVAITPILAISYQHGDHEQLEPRVTKSPGSKLSLMPMFPETFHGIFNYVT